MPTSRKRHLVLGVFVDRRRREVNKVEEILLSSVFGTLKDLVTWGPLNVQRELPPTLFLFRYKIISETKVSVKKGETVRTGRGTLSLEGSCGP